jgi:hypothetical protein
VEALELANIEKKRIRFKENLLLFVKINLNERSIFMKCNKFWGLFFIASAIHRTLGILAKLRNAGQIKHVTFNMRCEK